MAYLRDITLTNTTGAEPMIGPFGEVLMGHKMDDVVVSFEYPFYNTTYDLQSASLTGDGAASVASSLLTVSSTTGTAKVSSKESVRYRPGHTGFIDMTASFSGAGTGYIGGFDASDGFIIRVINGALSVGYRRSGVDTFITAANFNGEDISALDLTKINIFRVIFGYLGVANPTFMVKLGKWRVIHQIPTENTLTTTHVGNPSFPVSVETSGAMSIKSASWNAGTINGSDTWGARFFEFGGSGTLSSTNLLTLTNFRNKTTYKTVSNKVKASLLRYKFFVDSPVSGTGTVEFKITRNATLSGTPSYTDIDADNSVMEYDTTATYLSGGQNIFTDWVGYASGTAPSAPTTGGDSSEVAQSFGLYLLPGESATITAQNVDGTSNVTVRAVFNWIELF